MYVPPHEAIQNEKYVLTNVWELWTEDSKQEAVSSSTNHAKRISSFETINEFWDNYTSMCSCAELRKGVDVFFVKSGNLPNKGSKIHINFSSEPKEKWDEIFLNCLLPCIGETIPHQNNIIGISYGIRSKLTIKIWYNNLTEEEQQHIIRYLEECEDLPKFETTQQFKH
ncbi:Eukaryotic translation initiation factor 4E [Entamoeba marina]